MEVNKSNRLLALYTKLMDGENLDKKEAAYEFGVNEKTIQRDLDDLKNFLDYYYFPRQMDITLRFDYRKKQYCLTGRLSPRLRNDETFAVCKILLESRAFSKEKMAELLDRIIKCCVPQSDSRMVTELAANELFHYIEPCHRVPYLDYLWELATAVREKRIVEIDYQRMSSDDTIKRRIKPVGIMFSEYYFYLAAFIDDAAHDFPYPAIYRLDRIKAFDIRQERFNIPYKERFEEGEFRKRIQFMYAGELLKIKMRYYGQSVEAVLDRLPTAEIVASDEMSTTIVAEVFGPGVKMWLLSQGSNIETLEPVALREQIRDDLLAMLQFYQ